VERSLMFAQQIVNGLVLGSIYALSALGFTLIFGVAKLVNFAYGEMIMVGAFLTLVLSEALNLNFFVALLLAMAVMAAVSVVLYQTLIRPVLGGSELRALLVTTGMLYVLRQAAILVMGTAPQQLPMGIEGVLIVGGVIVTYQRLTVIGITLVLILALYVLLYRLRIGRAVRAVAQNREGAVAIGLNVNRTISFTMAVSGALACAAGGLLGSLYAVEPQMGGVPLLKAFIVVIFGGLGSVPGAIIGGLIIGLIETLAGVYISFAFKDVFMFLVLIAVLIGKPTGLMGKAQT
jgi:branched-chain amino acid transport system permease protein